MTDICSAHVYLRGGDIPKFSEIFGEPNTATNLVHTSWYELMYESCNYGDHSGLVECASAKLRFYGHHGPGSTYPGMIFASNGDGTLYMTRAMEDSEGQMDAVVAMNMSSGYPDTDDLELVTGVVDVYRELEEESRGGPIRLPQKAFSSLLEARLDCFDNAAIVAEIGHDHGVVMQLLDYIRANTTKFMKKAVDFVVIKNQAPECDAIDITLERGSSVHIWREEHGGVNVDVRSSDGMTSSMVLGQEGYTQKL